MVALWDYVRRVRLTAGFLQFERGSSTLITNLAEIRDFGWDEYAVLWGKASGE